MCVTKATNLGLRESKHFPRKESPAQFTLSGLPSLSLLTSVPLWLEWVLGLRPR